MEVGRRGGEGRGGGAREEDSLPRAPDSFKNPRSIPKSTVLGVIADDHSDSCTQGAKRPRMDAAGGDERG